MSTTDFLVTSGALSAGSIRLGLRALLPTPPAFARKVTDEEAAAFVASLAPTAPTSGPSSPLLPEPSLVPVRCAVDEPAALPAPAPVLVSH